jgi:cytoskeleton protein RodZ
MSDGEENTPAVEPMSGPATAGGLLRQARVAKGLHIAALATSIKVAPRKLELLEADRYEELPGATFTRALAQTVCRTLKIDAAPVLALLPQPADQGLSHMSLGLNAPFRDKPGRRVPSDLAFLRSPVLLGAALLVVASLLLYFVPAGWVSQFTQEVTTETASTPPATSPGTTTEVLPPMAPAVSDAGSAASPASAAGVMANPAVDPASAAPAASVLLASPSGALLLRAQAQSWVEVIDGRGNPLMSRLLDAGETVGLDGPTPLRVRIGNAAATQVSFRGRPVELAPTRDNVAKLELR